MEFDYKKEIEIDPDNLDLECVEHASRYQKYSQRAAEVRFDLDKAKRKIDVVAASVNLEIRRRAKKQDEKYTEAEFKSMVEANPKVEEAWDEYLKVKREYDMLSAAVMAFDHRKRSLTNLVNLHGQGYFASPATRPLVRERARKEQDARVDKKVAEALNRGRKP